MNFPEVKIIEVAPIRLAGLSIHTSLSEGKVTGLWKEFRSIQKQFQNPKAHPSYSVSIYEPGLRMKDFNPDTKFEKWAAVQLAAEEELPKGINELIIPSGIYAMFVYQGTVRDFHATARQFFGEWIPQSDYEVDDRPHFEILDERYLGPMNPESEEEIWIPVKKNLLYNNL